MLSHVHQACLVPDAGDAAQVIQLFATEVEPNPLYCGHAASEKKLVEPQRVVPSPVAAKFREKRSRFDANAAADRIFRIEVTAGAAHKMFDRRLIRPDF